MAKPADLSGKKFGNLTVEERAENNGNGNTMWRCKCDCGNYKIALGYDLTHGRTTSCGCQRGKTRGLRIKDLTGKKFGRLTVMEKDYSHSKRGELMWKCICDCGNITYVDGGNLQNGHIKSCGCISKDIQKNKREKKIGTKYGMLTVVEYMGIENGNSMWKCKCDCGNIKVVSSAYLSKKNGIRSCGCILSEKKRNRENHNMTKTRLYTEWLSMRARCKNTYYNHKNYFDKGICVCEEWDKNFGAFRTWSEINGYEETLTLDRIDNNKGYSPDNCRWANMKIQQNNRTNNVLITRNGETKTLKQWCDELGINYGAVKARRRRGWHDEDLFIPLRKNQYC